MNNAEILKDLTDFIRGKLMLDFLAGTKCLLIGKDTSRPFSIDVVGIYSTIARATEACEDENYYYSPICLDSSLDIGQILNDRIHPKNKVEVIKEAIKNGSDIKFTYTSYERTVVPRTLDLTARSPLLNAVELRKDGDGIVGHKRYFLSKMTNLVPISRTPILE